MTYSISPTYKINNLQLINDPEKSQNFSNNILKMHFMRNGKVIKEDMAPICNISLKTAGSMRFRWNEVNENRLSFFSNLNVSHFSKVKTTQKIAIPIELTHSKDVFALSNIESNKLKTLPGVKNLSNSVCATDFNLKQVSLENIVGDGFITNDKLFIPVVTVADCMPIFLFDPNTKMFGVCHSGWKGTGIATNAIKLANKLYGTNPKDVLVVMGPHIQSCCYDIDKDRAGYFITNFGENSIIKSKIQDKYSLSLATANKNNLVQNGILEENITISNLCTCCCKKTDVLEPEFLFGSFRRETAHLAQCVTTEEKMRMFTTMAAFIEFS